MSVYYVRSRVSGLVKIGYAADARKRFHKIQSDSPEELILAAIEDGDEAIERERHLQFAALRVRGEWFHDFGDLSRHIDSLPRPLEPARKIAASGPLGAWIASRGMTLDTFASLVGTTQATVSRVCNGVAFPRRELMLAIIEATDWEVDANDLLGISPPIARQSAA